MFVIQIFLIIFPILTSPKRLKIVNGTNADCSEFPFMVSLQNNSFHACGATILNRRFAMTAAHCVCNVISVDLKIYITHSLRSLGVPSERLIPVQSVICNDYSSIKHTNDIALLRLNYSIPLDLYHPVKMPPRNFETLENGEGILLGWGLVATNGNQPEILQKVSVMVYNDTICDESYYGIYDMKNNVCAGWPANGKGSCQGDSGGPLLVNGFQAGIISFGRSGDCGISNEETPKVLTRVSKYLDWIEQNSYWEEGSESRIVNGTDAKEGEFPFAVSLRKNASHICGATILNEKFILTAAHCVCKNNSPKDSKLYTIQYGLTKITKDPINTVQVSKITCNNFDSESLVYDSAVLELESPIPPSDSWKPVKICKKFDTHKEQVGTIIGWGRIGQDGPLSENLQKLDVDIYDDTVCGVTYNLEHHICFGAKNAGACNGDSGTALLVNGVQVGIASFISAECGIANKKHSNVYSKVPTYFKWIKSIAGHVET